AHDGDRSLAGRTAGSAIQSAPWKLVAPKEGANWRRMPSRFDFDELVNPVCPCGNAQCSITHALVGGVKEQLQRQLLCMAPHELLQWSIKTRNGDFGHLSILFPREFRGIVLHLDVLGWLLVPLNSQDRLCWLRH